MWTTIVSSLLPFAMRLIQSYIESKLAPKRAKRKWIEFVEGMADSMETPANLRESWRSQALRLKAEVGEPLEDLPAYRNREALLLAAKEIGTKEKPGEQDHPRILEYHAFSTEGNDVESADSIPWCASFVCWVLEKVGMESTNSKVARSFEYWGKSSLADPLPGDVVTFHRNGRESGQGHVGFLVKYDRQFVTILGGNQNNEVNISRYSTETMTDIRRSSKVDGYSLEQRNELFEIAENILVGIEVQPPGKVI